MPASAPVHGEALRVVIVTLDNHLSGAAERAAAQFAADGSQITIGFHAAADWDRDPGALERAKSDIARGDIVIATMLFLDDHIRAVLPALEARREHCAAMVGLMSGSEVVKLTRMGDYRMDKPAKGPLAMLKKLRGSGKPGASSGAGQMKMLRRLPKLLRFIPGTAQDVRAYFLTLQYWLAGSDDNVVGMIRALAARYAGRTRAGRSAARISRSRGLSPGASPSGWRPGSSRCRRPRKTTGTVGLLMLRSYLLGRDTGHYDGAIAAFEAKGLRVIPAFASGLDSRPAIEKFFVEDGKATVDAVVSLTGFSLVGGPAYNDAKAAETVLADLDVPYIAAHPLEFQSLQQWGASRQGLLPLEATMMVAIPELDGAVLPSVFGGRADGSGACTGCARRCDVSRVGPYPRDAVVPRTRRGAGGQGRQADRAAPFGACGTQACGGPVQLPAQRRGNRHRRASRGVGICSTPRSTKLAGEGWDVAVPADVDTLREAVLHGNAARYGADANVHFRIPADDHVRREPHLGAIEAQWGPAPGKQQSDGGSIHVLGAQFGKVFVGIQPAFGYEGDPMRLLFEGRFTPTHAFSAFYRWLREDFGADAVLHFGTHGALEFMPGKQTGLSGDCWPERLLGDLPNIYLYAANNPSEGLIAKRRSGATLVSYLTPALAEAGLYKGLTDLKALLERWRGSPSDDERAALEPMIVGCGRGTRSRRRRNRVRSPRGFTSSSAN